MSSIQLQTEEYRLTHNQQNLLSLKPTSPASAFQLNLHYNFPSLYCPKTEKVIGTLPSICEEKTLSTLFNTQLDAQFNLKSPSLKRENLSYQSSKSMRNLQDIDKEIYVPKPLSRYCQICKEKFQNYLQHVNHSSHQKKLKQSPVTNEDFNQMSHILQKKTFQLDQMKKTVQIKQKITKKNVTFNRSNDVMLRKSQSSHENFYFSSSRIIIQNENSNKENEEVKSILSNEISIEGSDEIFGSKKRIVQKDSGQNMCVTIGSVRNIQINEDIDFQEKRKYTSFKNIVWDQKDSLRDSKLDFQFQLGLNLN